MSPEKPATVDIKVNNNIASVRHMTDFVTEVASFGKKREEEDSSRRYTTIRKRGLNGLLSRDSKGGRRRPTENSISRHLESKLGR